MVFNAVEQLYFVSVSSHEVPPAGPVGLNEVEQWRAFLLFLFFKFFLINKHFFFALLDILPPPEEGLVKEDKEEEDEISGKKKKKSPSVGIWQPTSTSGSQINR